MRARVGFAHKRIRSRRNVLLAVLGVAALFMLVVSSSSANLPGSSFEGNDGNLLVNTAPDTDWANITPAITCPNGPGAGTGCIVDEPSGSNDNSFGTGTKEDSPDVTIVAGSIPPSKNDLTRSYIATSTGTTGDKYLYLAWERTNTNGDANIDFELNQKATPNWTPSTTGAITINRTAGDLLITYDFGGSGTPTIGLLHWLTSGAGNTQSQCFSANSLPCWGNQETLNGTEAEAAVNSGPVCDPILSACTSDSANPNLQAGQFGEAALDLSQIPSLFPPDTCEAFGSEFVKSRSSSSFTAEVKDFIAPGPIFVSNCAQPTISTTATGPVTAPTAITDTATLTGTTGPAPAASTVTFNVYAGSDTTCQTPLNTTPIATATTGTSGGNPTYTSAPFTPPSAGTYLWVASFAGDNHNDPVSGNCGDPGETSLVMASPTIATTAGPTVVLGSGTKLTDSAVLAGGNSPTGTITFTLAGPSPSSTVIDTEKVTVTGNGTYNTPTGFTPTAAGTYTWHAVYSGDTNNNGASDNGANESEVVQPASPAIVTVAGGSVVVGSGTPLTDTATLSGGFNPTGNITFTLTGPAPSSTVVDTEKVTVTGNGSYSTPTGFVPTATGTYTWHAVYSGDGNNNGASDNGANESEVVTSASPAIVTVAGGSVVIGSGTPLTDTATLSGGYKPTGTITFTLKNAANTVLDTETVTVTGNGSYSTPTGFVPTATGTYTWHAVYSGDGNNSGASDNGANESEVVTSASPKIVTVAGGSVVVGSGTPLTDTATLSGGFNPTGTITFTLKNAANTVLDTETVTVTGNGSYSTPTGFVPTATGTYTWHAVYSGDGNNSGASDNGANESEVVTSASPKIVTVAGGSVVVGSGTPLTDTATLSGGFNPTGTITFTLTGPAPSSTVIDTEKVTVTGNGSYSTPTGFVPTATGTYTWHAVYSGDGNNNGASDNGANESEVVTSASPKIVTVAGGSVVVGSGQPLTDTATLSGGFNPTGTITFTLKNAANTVLDTETVTVTGNGTYSTPTGFVPTATGTYTWHAVYSGDGNNNGASDNGANETETATPAAPAIVTVAGGPVVVGSGTPLTDKATLSGAVSPTGTITFTLTGPAPSSTVIDTETVTVTGNGTYSTPTGFVPTATGTYTWHAVYSGDGNNNGASDNGANESEVVTSASPAIVTVAGGSVVVGSGAKLTDTATLSGGYKPTGTITFTLTGPAPSSTVIDTEKVTVTGNGSYSTPTGFVPTATGTYTWHAVYSGDGNNNGASDNGANESEVVTSASPKIVTVAGGSVVVGSGTPLTDTATLSGGFNPTGTITFTLKNAANTVLDTETVTVTGNGSYTTPTGFVPTATGTYTWHAVYSGDGNNNGASDNGANESEVVTSASPAIVTVAGGSVVVGSGAKLTDTATLSGGFNPTGTITFTLTGPAPSSTVIDTEKVTVTGNGSYSTPTGFVPTAAGTYTWHAVYSGDGNNNGASDNGANESEAATPAGPAIVTTAGGTVVVGSGAKLTDSAVLSGAFNPTGTITFTLTGPAPSSTVIDTEKVTVTGNGTYNTPTGFVPTATGTYTWHAVYSGDGNNSGASDNGANESEVVTSASPAIVTVAGGPVVVGSGTPLTDKATLSGGFNPTGTITFTLTGPAPSSTVIDTEKVTVTENGSYSTPTGFIPTATGTYTWHAVYSGDGNNNGASDNGANESEVVTSASPAIVTTAGGTVVVGSGAKLTDSAVLSGGFNPTGTITFTLTGPAPSSAVVDTEMVTVTGNGTYNTPAGYVPTATGTYTWHAVYSGDTNNKGASDNGANESEVVTSASPAIVTVAGGAVVVGSGTPLTDTATLSGGFNPTGTITFTLKNAANAVLDTEMVTVTGNGTYSTPTGFIPTATGTYTWHAVYSGDGNNNGASDNGANESEVVQPASPAIVTVAGGPVVIGSGTKLTDTATLSGGFNPTGKITFTLKDPTNVLVDTETVTVTGNGTYSTPTGYLPTLAGTYTWHAVYSGDSNNNGASDNGANETQSVGQSIPTATTILHNAADNSTVADNTALDLGSGVYDVAHVATTDGQPLTGTVTFTFFENGSCMGPAAPSDIETGVSVDGSGNATSSMTNHLDLRAGAYSFDAQYIAGSDVNHTDSAVSACEPFSINQGPTGITTAVQPSTTVGLGTQVNDTAQLSGQVDGLLLGDGTTNQPNGATVTYEFFNNDSCTTGESEPVSSQVVDVQSDGTVPASSQQTLGAGSYSYLAVYSGNSNYEGSTADCEPFNVNTAVPTLSTTVKDNDGGTVDNDSPAPLGTPIHDTSTLGGQIGTFPLGGTADPATVTYDFFTNNSCSGDTPTIQTVNVAADGTVPDADPQTLGAGSYSYLAVYSGNSNYAPQTAACEPFEVSPATPTLTTTVKDGEGNAVTNAAPAAIGAPVHDTSTLGASVTGFALGDGTTSAPNGATVTYEFFANNNCSGETHTDQTVTVAADGTVPAGNAQSLAAGSYSYLATYSGNANYTTQTASCEPFAVSKGTPSTTTSLHNVATLTAFPNGTALGNGSGVYDVATVTTSDSFALSGTVTFQFFNNGTCTGSPASTQTGVAITNGTATSSNQLNLGTGNYAFDAEYIAGSADANHNNSAVSGCEPFSVNPAPSSPSNPAITITKNPKSQTINSGGTATWTITVTNTGNVPLNVTVTDQLAPNCNASGSTIAALGSLGANGGTVTYNCSLTGVTASFTNVAVATGVSPSGQTVSAQDTAPVTVTTPPPPPPAPEVTHPAITIVKDPKSQSLAFGGTAHFHITVTNTGDVTLSNVTVSDQLSPDCNRSLGTLGVGHSKSYTCTQPNVQAGFQNVAVATGKPPTGATVKATDHADISAAPFVPPAKPGIKLTKNPKHQTVTTTLKTSRTPTGATNTTVTYGTAHFRITVKNMGNTPLSVTVSDPQSTNCNKHFHLAQGASHSYSCSKPTVTRAFTNVATATGVSPAGTKVHSTDHANVAVTTKTTSKSGAKFTG